MSQTSAGIHGVMAAGIHDVTTAEIKVKNAKSAKKKKTRLQSTLYFGLNSVCAGIVGISCNLQNQIFELVCRAHACGMDHMFFCCPDVQLSRQLVHLGRVYLATSLSKLLRKCSRMVLPAVHVLSP